MFNNKRKGFLAIEIAALLGFIGLFLANSVVPEYGKYYRRGKDVQVEAALRNLAIAQETFFVDNQKYFSSFEELENADVGFRMDPDVVYISMEVKTSSSGSSYFIAKAKLKGENREIIYNSLEGGIQE